jgi:hypothetical protein
MLSENKAKSTMRRLFNKQIYTSRISEKVLVKYNLSITVAMEKNTLKKSISKTDELRFLLIIQQI